MNLNGKITGDTPGERLIEYVTSWRAYLGGAIIMAAFYVPPAYGAAGYGEGFVFGSLGFVLADRLFASMLPGDE